MECTHSQEWMSAYLDAELDASAQVQVEMHLAGCGQCKTTLAQFQSLQTSIAQQGMRYAAPDALRDRIQMAITTQRLARPARKAISWRRNWLGAGAIGLSTAAVALFLALNLFHAPPDDLFDQELIASHFRSLMPNHLADVASSDQHTVKPWFAGKLDFSPPVIDLARQGYALIGGRLDYLNQRPVAAIVYQYRKHIVNLYVWLAAGRDTAPHASTRQGFQLLRWRQAGMQFVAVSDMNAQQMDEFASAVREPGRDAARQPGSVTD